jgi:hypothetical protein
MGKKKYSYPYKKKKSSTSPIKKKVLYLFIYAPFSMRGDPLRSPFPIRESHPLLFFGTYMLTVKKIAFSYL